MKKKFMFAFLTLAMAACLAVGTSCGGGGDSSSGNTPSSSEQDSGGTASPSDSQTGEYSAPIITVTPDKVEIYQGDEIELLYGVSVSDEYDSDLRATITDDDGFNKDVIGEYTITYSATNSKGKTGTATRTITVLAPLAKVVLETQYAYDTKWENTVYLTFANKDFVTLTEDTTYEAATSGVFFNDSEEEILLTVPGGYGEAAIIDENGVVVEGRDGANGRFVNEEYPIRAESSATSFVYGEETVKVTDSFAKYMSIPANGFAIVVQTNYAGSGFDADGRSFIAKNVIYQYGAVVQLYMEGSEEAPLTTYKDRAPTVSGATTIQVKRTEVSAEAIEEQVVSGLTITDDNGTFKTDDDITTGLVPTITDDGGYDSDTVGTYTFSLEVADAKGNKTNFTRDVEVVDAEFATMTVGEKNFSVLKEKVAIDKALTAIGDYSLIIYTPAYEGEITFSNGYGIAFVLDEYGTLVRIYDGANAKYYDEDNVGGIKDEGKCTSAGYVTEAFNSLSDGEYLVIAPNSTANSAKGGSRDFLLNAKTIGAAVTLTDIQFKSNMFTITIGANSKEFARDTVLVDSEFTAAEINLVIYNFGYTGTVSANGYGEAFVVDKFGVVVRIYDGANGKYYDAENPNGEGKCTPGKYLEEAFASLKEGERVICGPNGGLDNNAGRKFLLDNRKIGTQMALTDIEFEKTSITIDGTEQVIDRGRIAVNQTVKAYTDLDYVVYDSTFEGEVTANGWGVAIIVDAEGKIVRVYDGIAGKYFDAANPNGVQDGTCTSAGYLKEAFDSLQEGEILIAGVNNGGEQAGRTFLNGFRKIGLTVVLKNILD